MKNKQLQQQIEETQSFSQKVNNEQFDLEDRELERYTQHKLGKMQIGFNHFKEKIKKAYKNDWY
jgi:hypothetical protein